jgi:hypothetical protein
MIVGGERGFDIKPTSIHAYSLRCVKIHFKWARFRWPTFWHMKSTPSETEVQSLFYLAKPTPLLYEFVSLSILVDITVP